MKTNPRNYPDTMISAESGRPMTRGDKPMAVTVDGKTFHYNQPGWWCSLTDSDDREGQLVDGDNQVGDMARRTANALAAGEPVFVPIVIRAIRERCGLSQREAGRAFGGGTKSFEKYESGAIRPSGPTKRLLEIAMAHPSVFAGPATKKRASSNGNALIRHVLKAAGFDALYAPLFDGSDRPDMTRSKADETESAGSSRSNTRRSRRAETAA